MADLNREDFNRAASAQFNNTYDSDSRAVLTADLQLAVQQGDARAQQSIRRNLLRVKDTSMPGNYQPPQVDTAGVTDEPRTALQQQTTLLPDLERAIFGANQQQQAAAEQQRQAVIAGADATARAATLQAESVISEQDAHMQLLRAVGLDVNDPQSALRQELDREAAARFHRESIDKEITNLEGINFFQNPFAFMAAQPKLQQLTAQYNNFAREENSSGANINQLQQLATTVSALTPAKNADLLRQKAQADAEAVKQQAAATAAQISEKNAAGYAKSMLDVFNARHNVFQSILGVTNVEEAIKDRRQRMENDNFWRGIKLNELEDQRAEKKAERDKVTALVTGINLYRRAINGSAVPDLTAEDVKRMPADIRDHWYTVMLRGNYGNDYSQSIPFISVYGNKVAAADSGNAGMMTIISNTEKRAQAMAADIINQEKLKNPMSPAIKRDDAIRMAYQQLWQQDAALAAKGSDKSSVAGSNPLAIDFDAAAALGAATAKAGDPGVVYKTLMEIKQRQPGASLNQTLTPRQLLNEIESRVAAGGVDPKKAAQDTANFFGSQSAATWGANGLQYLNIPRPVDWNVAAGATGKNMVDLMNPSQLENYLTSRVAAERRAQGVGKSPAFGIFN